MRAILVFISLLIFAGTTLANTPIIGPAVNTTKPPGAKEPIDPNEKGIQVRFSVYDAAEKLPIELARVVLRRDGKLIMQDATNTAGQLRFRDIEPGKYELSVWFIGYKTYIDSMQINETNNTFRIDLQPQSTT